MKEKIITSVQKKHRRPLVAGLLTFLVTGLGQVYNGEAGKGMVLFLLRIVPLMLIPVYGTHDMTLTQIRFTALMAGVSTLVWFAAVFEAVWSAGGKGAMSLKEYNSTMMYILYALFGSIGLSAALLLPASFLGVHRVSDGFMMPTLVKGEYTLLYRGAMDIKRGDVVVYLSGDLLRVSRVIGVSGDTVGVSDGSFSVNKFPLAVGVYTAAELALMGIPNREDTFFEINGSARYAIIADAQGIAPRRTGEKIITVPAGFIFVAGDNRKMDDNRELIEGKAVIGKITGIIAGGGRERILIRVTFPSG